MKITVEFNKGSLKRASKASTRKIKSLLHTIRTKKLALVDKKPAKKKNN